MVMDFTLSKVLLNVDRQTSFLAESFYCNEILFRAFSCFEAVEIFVVYNQRITVVDLVDFFRGDYDVLKYYTINHAQTM
jgi:hypothetical protein